MCKAFRTVANTSSSVSCCCVCFLWDTPNRSLSSTPEPEFESELALACFQSLLAFSAVSSLVPPPVTWVALFYGFEGCCICPVFELIYFIVIVCLTVFPPFHLEASLP